MSIAFGIQSSGHSGDMTGRLWKNDRSAVRQGFEFYRKRSLAWHPLSFHVRGVSFSGREHRHRKMGRV